jgi:disulfide bond formation protein DsbB
MILHWIVWVFIALGFFGLLIFFIQPHSLRITAIVTITILATLQFAATIYTMLTDPQDPKVVQAGLERNVHYVKSLGVPVIDPDTLFCRVCQVHVDKGTKHCKVSKSITQSLHTFPVSFNGVCLVLTLIHAFIGLLLLAVQQMCRAFRPSLSLSKYLHR